MTMRAPEQKVCGIPSRTIGACDLEWGHIGAEHANSGDGFVARDYEDEHRQRQAARAKADPIYRLRAHCEIRIEECRKIEQKFATDYVLRDKRKRMSTAPMAQTMIEAWTERMTLQRVLNVLDDVPEIDG